jgi:hypothetical protein
MKIHAPTPPLGRYLSSTWYESTYRTARAGDPSADSVQKLISKSPPYKTFPTAANRADRIVGPRSPLPCQAWHGFEVSFAYHGEVRRCLRACKRTPSGAAAAAPPAGANVRKLFFYYLESVLGPMVGAVMFMDR